MTIWMEWALTSCFLILAVLLLRAVLGKHISAGLRYALWAVVLVRLLVPVQLFTAPIPLSVIRERTESQTVQTGQLPQGQFQQGWGAAPALNVGNTVLPNLSGNGAVNVWESSSQERPETAKPTVAALNWEAVQNTLIWAWMGGAAAMGLALLLSNARFALTLRRRRRALNGTGCSLPVYIADGLPSPCLFGLFAPAVYVLPETVKSPAMLCHVLAHEETHARHLDHIWSLARCAVLAIHWWNPLVWLAVSLSRRDGELACDEGALKRLGDGERKAYGCTLLTIVTARCSPVDLLNCATTMSGSKRALWERVGRIAKAPKRLLWAVVLAVVVAALATACSFAKAAEPDDLKDTPDDSPIQSESVNLDDMLDSLGGNKRQDGMYETDLNRNGIPETMEVRWVEDNEGIGYYRLTVTEGERELYSTEGFFAHAGWTAIFLYDLDGEDYLLEYHPYMGQGFCNYWYQLFYLGEDGQPVIVQQSEVDFDINFGSPIHESFDPEAIAIFLDEVNSLLAGSTPVLITDNELASTFEAQDALVDIPWWLRMEDEWELYTYDGDKILLENLRAYKNAMEEAAVQRTMLSVPEAVLMAAREYVSNQFDGAQMTYSDPNSALGNLGIELDTWRIESLTGPWYDEAEGLSLEIWRMNYELHTTTPEAAMNVIVGGNYLTEDGWLCNTYPNTTWLIFRLDAANDTRSLLTVMMCNDSQPGNDLFHETLEQMLYNMGWTAPETEDDYVLRVKEGDTILYLLRSGYVWLERGGYSGPVAGLRFSTDASVALFPSGVDDDEVTIMLTKEFEDHDRGAQLTATWIPEAGEWGNTAYEQYETDINGNGVLERMKRVYCSTTRWYMAQEPQGDRMETVWTAAAEQIVPYAGGAETYDGDVWIWVQAIPMAHYNAWTGEYYEAGQEFFIRRGEWTGYFSAACPVRTAGLHLADLDGDSVNEIIIDAEIGHGTGVSVSELHVFASVNGTATCREMDTSGLVDMIIGQIESTTDKDNFYLSAPGMEVIIPKADWNIPDSVTQPYLLDAIGFGEIVSFDVEDGRLYCTLGAAHVFLTYCGEVRVGLHVENGQFVCDSFAFSTYG